MEWATRLELAQRDGLPNDLENHRATHTLHPHKTINHENGRLHTTHLSASTLGYRSSYAAFSKKSL